MPRQRHDPSLYREQSVLYVEDLMHILGIKQSKAYQLLRKLNAELEARGYITIAGRVSEQYFYERLYGGKPQQPAYQNK